MMEVDIEPINYSMITPQLELWDGLTGFDIIRFANFVMFDGLNVELWESRGIHSHSVVAIGAI